MQFEAQISATTQMKGISP